MTAEAETRAKGIFRNGLHIIDGEIVRTNPNIVEIKCCNFKKN